MEDSLFCTKCGAELRADMCFCPKCGAVVAGTETEKKMKSDYEKMRRDSMLMWAQFLLIIYAIPVLVIGIISVINADGNAQTLWNNSNFQDWLRNNHLLDKWNKDKLVSIFTLNGIMAIVSGLSAGTTLVLLHLRKYWIVAFVACIVSTVFSSFSFIGIFVGIFVCWMIFDLKPFFNEPAKPAEPI